MALRCRRVLAAMPLTLACGNRVEDAQALKMSPMSETVSLEKSQGKVLADTSPSRSPPICYNTTANHLDSPALTTETFPL